LMVNCLNSAAIKYLSLSLSKLLSRQSWWQR
jgi:hypothetical protein